MTAWRGRAATPLGFLLFEYGLSGKWLELLKEIAPGVTRAAVLRDPATASGLAQFGASRQWRRRSGGGKPDQSARCAEIERAVAAFARSSNGGLIVTASGSAAVHRNLIVTLAKWLELLKEIAPRVTRAAVFRDPTCPRASALCRHPSRRAVAQGPGKPDQSARR